MQLLEDERRAYLVHGDGGSERGKGKQGVEQHADHISEGGRESLLEDVGQRDEDERRAAVGVDAHGESRGENHQSGEHRHHGIDKRHLNG